MKGPLHTLSLKEKITIQDQAKKLLQQSHLVGLQSYPEIHTFQDYKNALHLYVSECFFHEALYDVTCGCPQSQESKISCPCTYYIPGIREYHTVFTDLFFKLKTWRDENLEAAKVLEYDTEFFNFHRLFVKYIREKYGQTQGTGYFNKGLMDEVVWLKFTSLCDSMGIGVKRNALHQLFFNPVHGLNHYRILHEILKESSLYNGIPYPVLKGDVAYRHGCMLLIKEALVFRNLCRFTIPRSRFNGTIPEVTDFIMRLETLTSMLKAWHENGDNRVFVSDVAYYSEFVDLLHAFDTYFKMPSCLRTSMVLGALDEYYKATQSGKTPFRAL